MAMFKDPDGNTFYLDQPKVVPPDDRDYGLRDFSCKDLDGNIIVFGTDIS